MLLARMKSEPTGGLSTALSLGPRAYHGFVEAAHQAHVKLILGDLSLRINGIE